jgi:hypothetical protein
MRRYPFTSSLIRSLLFVALLSLGVLFEVGREFGEK